MTFPLNRPRGPQSERMLAVLDAVASLPLATSPTIAERCGITVAQAAVSLHYLAKAGRATRKDIAMSAQGRRVIVWGTA